MVKSAAKRGGIKNLAPHDLRRYAESGIVAAPVHGYAIWRGGEVEQIQFLRGQASAQTTERYLGCYQKLSQAVNDNLGLEDIWRE